MVVSIEASSSRDGNRGCQSPSSAHRLRILYVASIGRSGSTLLDSILGAHPDVATAGEIHLWPHELDSGGVLRCGSGEFVGDCPFWTEMLRHVDPRAQRGPSLTRLREAHHHGRTARFDRIRDLGSRPLSGGERAPIMDYARNSEEIFAAFAEVAAAQGGREPRWIVDASKDPWRLLWLARSGLFDLRVVHLVRDPRAFVHSVTRLPGAGAGLGAGWKRHKMALRQSISWVVHNRLISMILDSHVDPSCSLVVRYEDLAAEPFSEAARICGLLDLDFDSGMVEDFRGGSPFAMGGNTMRHREGPIRLDRRWESDLPWSRRLIAGAVATGSRRRYGY